MSFSSTSKSELELADENSDWIPGALVVSKRPGGDPGKDGGLGIIIALYGESVFVLWSKQPDNDDFRLVEFSFVSSVSSPVIYQTK